MLDRPTAEELLDAVRMHLESHIIPVIKSDRKLYFQTLVAINILRIIEREMGKPGYQKEEWVRLMSLLGDDAPVPEDLTGALMTQNSILADAIRAGDYDSSQTLFDHLMTNTITQLEIANPLFLMKIIGEVNDPSLDAWSNR